MVGIDPCAGFPSHLQLSCNITMMIGFHLSQVYWGDKFGKVVILAHSTLHSSDVSPISERETDEG